MNKYIYNALIVNEKKTC